MLLIDEIIERNLRLLKSKKMKAILQEDGYPIKDRIIFPQNYQQTYLIKQSPLLAQKKIKGNGLIANCKILAGTILGVFHKVDMSTKKLSSLDNVSQEKLNLSITHYAVNTYNNSKTLIGLPLPEVLEAARELKLAPIYFINHSDDRSKANVEFYYEKFKEGSPGQEKAFIIFRALEDIEKGTELTGDYGKTYQPENEQSKIQPTLKTTEIKRTYSEEEKEILQKFVVQFPNDWKKIAEQFKKETGRDRSHHLLASYFQRLTMRTTFLPIENTSSTSLLDSDEIEFLRHKVLVQRFSWLDATSAYNAKYNLKKDYLELKKQFYAQEKKNKNKAFSNEQCALIQQLVEQHGEDNMQEVWEAYQRHKLGDIRTLPVIKRCYQKHKGRDFSAEIKIDNFIKNNLFFTAHHDKGGAYYSPEETKELCSLSEKYKHLKGEKKWTLITILFNQNKDKKDRRSVGAIKRSGRYKKIKALKSIPNEQLELSQNKIDSDDDYRNPLVKKVKKEEPSRYGLFSTKKNMLDFSPTVQKNQFTSNRR